MQSDSSFDSIRPYKNGEIDDAVDRLVHSKEFLSVFTYLTKLDAQTIVSALNNIHTRDEFQFKVWKPLIDAITKHTVDELTVDGIEYIDPDKSYLFVSNHRDIIMDSAILNKILIEHGKKYCQSAIGSNLLVNEWVTDLVKLESCFVIERNISVREMISSSALRSEYIRQTILENQNSIWIAQKEGRTKNGDDRTQQSLLKMFKMSGSKNMNENFRELNVVPVSISYEWESCDELKTAELYVRSVGTYIKTPEDDMRSMQHGLGSYKGRVHFTINKPVDIELDEIENLESNGARIEALAKLMDERIQGGFRLWPNNYIAYDVLENTNRFVSEYTPEAKAFFIAEMERKLVNIQGDKDAISKIYLEIYANPVINKYSDK